MKKIFLSFFSLLIILSCTINSQKERKKEIKKIVNEWNGKLIEMPDSVFILENGILTIPLENPFNVGNQKILTFISGDCEKCINNLNDWVVLLDSVNIGKGLQLIVIILSSDIEQFIREFSIRVPQSIIPYLDVRYKFLTTYNLPLDWDLRTFLLDNHNRVVLIGNPLHNLNLKKLYLQKIKENEKTIY
jgi:hypothetical protein